MKAILITFILFLQIFFVASPSLAQSCDSLMSNMIEMYGDNDERTLRQNIDLFSDLFEKNHTRRDCPTVQATSCRALINLYIKAGEYSAAEDLSRHAVTIDTKAKDTIGLAKTYGLKTSIATDNDQPLKALEYSKYALTFLATEEGKGYPAAPLKNQILLNRANCLRALLRYAEAKEIYLKLVEQGSGVEDIALQGLGDIACDQFSFTEAIEYYKRLYPIFEGNMSKLSHLEHSIGTTYTNAGKTVKAKLCFIRSETLAKQSGQDLIRLYSLVDLIRLPPGLLPEDSLKMYKEELLALSEKGIGSQSDKSEMLLEIVADFIDEDKNTEAFFLLKDYGSKSKDKNFLKFYHEVKHKVKSEQTHRLGGIFTAALLAVIFFFLYARKRDRESAQKELEKQELSEKAAFQELNHTEEILKTEYKLREQHAMQAHDLKSAVTGIRNGLQALVDYFHLSAPAKEDLHMLHQDALDLSDNIRKLSHRLNPDTKEWLHGMQRMLDRLEKDRSIQTEIKTENITEETVSAFTGHQLLAILRVLIENVKEHAEATRLTVHVRNEKEELILEVKDNGRGNFSYPRDEGVGLKSVRRKTEELHGTMQINTNEGTLIIIKLPPKEKQ